MSNDPYPHEQPPPGGDGSPYGSRPYSDDPYKPVDRPEYARPPAPYVPPGAGPGYVPGPGTPPPPPYGYAPPRPVSASTVVLVVFSALATMSLYCCFIGIPPLIMGIIALTRQQTDPEGADRMTRYGWITFASLTALTFICIAAVVVIGVASGSGA